MTTLCSTIKAEVAEAVSRINEASFDRVIAECLDHLETVTKARDIVLTMVKANDGSISPLFLEAVLEEADLEYVDCWLDLKIAATATRDTSILTGFNGRFETPECLRTKEGEEQFHRDVLAEANS